jgi:polyisoprenoid-binding protein YceI
MSPGWCALLAAGLGAASPTPSRSDQDSIPPGALRSASLSFDGRATLGDFTGTTTTALGRMTGGATLREVRGWVELPVATFRTGNGMRDRDLRGALEADQHPVIRFDLDGVALLGSAGDSTRVMLTGRFTIRGVTRDVGVPGTVEFTNEGIHLRSRFPMNLNDYGVRRLSRMLGLLRMQPDIMVHVDLLWAPAAVAAPPAAAPDGPPPASG